MIPATIACLLLIAPLSAQDHPFETDALRVPVLDTGGGAVIQGVTIHTATEPAFVGTVVVLEGKIVAVSKEAERKRSGSIRRRSTFNPRLSCSMSVRRG